MTSSTTTNKNGEWSIKFVPFSSAVDSSFWVRYCREKLETIKLNEEPISINASFRPTTISATGLPILQFQENSLLQQQQQNDVSVSSVQSESSLLNDRITVNGKLIGYNTSETFQKVDKNALLRDNFVPQFLQLGSSNAYEVSKFLNQFILLTFADLKNYKVLYWFGMHALVPCSGSILALEANKAKECFSVNEHDELTRAVQTMQQASQNGLVPFFIHNINKNVCSPLCKDSYSIATNDDKELFENILFGFFDPIGPVEGPSEDQAPMGWPLRNLVAYLSFHLDLGGKIVQIMSYRTKRIRKIDNLNVSNNDDQSIMLKVKIPLKEEYGFKGDDLSTQNFDQYKVLGWELNARSKPGPRWVNLRPLLDSNHLAIQAADLNLKLMKWRMIPDLNIEKLQSSKVLMLGAGTLGCSVARTLLGWGVRKFKFVDYGKVSYSNPVRQNLFTLEDCHADSGSGRPKAVAASDALKTIAADVESEGIVLSIPMPGHSSDNTESLKSTVETLDNLIKESDIVFLLTDTRESRWLPTVMAAAHNKMLINAALGLDSWLVMRHGGGIYPLQNNQQRYGCYFCNDVVAPENSTRNRTLDQQCTVTRPGLAPIASSMAVELMVALIHHPEYLAAPAPISASNTFSPTVASSNISPLGIIPHQIRGSLVSYTMMIPTVPAFNKCTACSEPIIDSYKNDKIDLVANACESADGSYLENLSGLTAFRIESDSKMEAFENWEEDEE